jgi:hypothetical protein
MQTEERPGDVHAEGAVTKTPVEASQGIKLGTMRYVLGISLALAIIGVAIAYFIA